MPLEASLPSRAGAHTRHTAQGRHPSRAEPNVNYLAFDEFSGF